MTYRCTLYEDSLLTVIDEHGARSTFYLYHTKRSFPHHYPHHTTVKY